MGEKKQWPWPPEHGEVTRSGKHDGNRYCEYHEKHHGPLFQCHHYPKRILDRITRPEPPMEADEAVRRWWHAFTDRHDRGE
jgi:hypothetical protein